jgi:hypothetical protein
MTQTAERERVKARIRALCEKTVSNGCTEAEALAAAEMVGRLLERYALTMDEIELRQTRCVQASVPLGSKRRRPIDGCVPAIARFCDCKVWLARTEKDGGEAAHYVFFGFEPDTALATYLYSVIARAMAGALAEYRVGSRQLAGQTLRRASVSFQHGMAMRIAERLAAMHAEREASVASHHASGTALVLVKHSVVEEAFRETRIRLVSTTAAARPADAAFRHGRAAGERVNLNRPVPANGRARLA